MSEQLEDSKDGEEQIEEESQENEYKNVEFVAIENVNYDYDHSECEDYEFMAELEREWEIVDDKFSSTESIDWEKEAKKTVNLDVEVARERRKSIFELDSYASSGPSVVDLLRLGASEATVKPPKQVRYSVSMGVQGIARINISPLTQKIVGCVIGENVSTEYPWVYVRKEIIEDNIDLHEESSDFLPIKEEIQNFPNTKILIGYVPSLTDDGQFYICLTAEGQDAVVDLIQRKREEYENRVRTAVYKPLGVWTELGTSEELQTTIVENTRPLLQIEVVSTAESLNTTPQLVDRDAENQRDGYIELLCYRQTFENISRQLLHNATQASPMVRETVAQTDLSIPTNSWVQYQYEYKRPDISKLNEEQTESLKNFLDHFTNEICDQVLLNATWDIYTNDYENLIRDISDTQWSIPAGYKEHLSFHAAKRTFDKVISDLSWHPFWTGVAFSAYTRYSKSHRLIGPKSPEAEDSEDNYVLVWSFTDSLTPKLILECPREVTSVAVNPLNGTLIIGGCVNGQRFEKLQVVLWHIPGKIEEVEAVIVHTSAQIKYKIAVKNLTTWMQEVTGTSVVRPTAMSSLKFSHKGSITQIVWISPYDKVDENGRIITMPEDTDPEDLSKQFVTASADGTIAFWDLNLKSQKLVKDTGRVYRKKGEAVRPKELQESISPYKILDRIFRPHYSVVVQHPNDSRKHVITTLNIYTPQFEKVRADTRSDSKDVTVRRFFKAKIKPPEHVMEPKILVGTVEGDFGCITWEGYEFTTDVTINTELCKWLWIKKVHDGPVVQSIRSKFANNIVATIGGKIFAIWREDFGIPLVWKKSDVVYTACSWGTFRATVLLLARMDGNIEIWDIAVKSEEPCLSQSLSGRIITGIYRHELRLVTQCVGFCDFNGTLRTFLAPIIFLKYESANKKWMNNFTQRQCDRIKKFNDWQEEWTKKNFENVEKMQKLTQDVAKQIELQEKEKTRLTLTKVDQLVAESKKPTSSWEFLEGAREKWKERELKRMQQAILEKKGLRKDDLEKQRAPILKMRHDAKKKENKLKETLGNQEKIFTHTMTIFFPKHYKKPQQPSLSTALKQLPSKEDKDFMDSILQQEVQLKQKEVNQYEEIIYHFMETQAETLNLIQKNPYAHSFNWREMLKEGKSRRISMDTKLQKTNRSKK